MNRFLESICRLAFQNTAGRGSYLAIFILITFTSKPLFAENGPATKPAKPNILFIFADDLAFDCVHYLGNDQVQTPNLDQLAKQGTVFTHAYNMGAWNGAVCLASRAMLNTGKTVWRANLSNQDMKEQLQSNGLLWSQRMAKAGYQTFMTGKWHVTVPPHEIFDVTRNIRGGMPKQTKAGYDRPKSKSDKSWSPSDPSFGGYWEGGKHWSEVVADDAIDFLNTAADNPDPFFMYIGFNAAHDPRQAPKEFVNKYPPDSIRLPQPFLNEYPFELPMKRVRDEVLAPFPRTPHAVQVNRAEYYAIISHMDEQIGRILAELKRLGQTDNTYIVFTADHGLAVGHHGLMGKQNLFDHSIRVPFSVTGPSIKANHQLDTKIYLQDVMPTTLEWAGAETDGVEFKSILPLLDGAENTSYDAIYGGYTQTQRCIVKDNFKLLLYPGLKTRLLFDLENDPFETTDLSHRPQHQSRIGELTRRLKELQMDFDDKLSLEFE